jgi:hypothetical protein
VKAGLSRGSVDVLKILRPCQPEWEDLPLPDEARDGKPHEIDASFADGLAAQVAMAAVIDESG